MLAFFEWRQQPLPAWGNNLGHCLAWRCLAWSCLTALCLVARLVPPFVVQVFHGMAVRIKDTRTQSRAIVHAKLGSNNAILQQCVNCLCLRSGTTSLRVRRYPPALHPHPHSLSAFSLDTLSPYPTFALFLTYFFLYHSALS